MHDRPLAIQLILVPAGVEYWAVKWGLYRAKQSAQALPKIMAIPAGPSGVQTFLETGVLNYLSAEDGVLLVGLGGGLSHTHAAGDGIVLSRICHGLEESDGAAYDCDPTLTRQIAERLVATVGTGVTCDRVVTTAEEKKRLCDRFKADVVDMESAVLVGSLAQATNCKVAVLRVISDDAQSALPDISSAISEKGELQIGAIAMSFLRQPVAAMRLIRSAQKGLSGLSAALSRLF
ncbi:MAG: phosphorylase [Cyanobacteria bacterium J06623_4]